MIHCLVEHCFEFGHCLRRLLSFITIGHGLGQLGADRFQTSGGSGMVVDEIVHPTTAFTQFLKGSFDTRDLEHLMPYTPLSLCRTW